MARRSVAAAAAAGRTVLFTRRCAASAAGVAGFLERAESGSSSRAVGAKESGVKFGALRASLVGVFGRSSSGCARAWYGDFGRLVPTAGPAFSFPGVALVLSPESVRFGAGSRRLTFRVFSRTVSNEHSGRTWPHGRGRHSAASSSGRWVTQQAAHRQPRNAFRATQTSVHKVIK